MLGTAYRQVWLRGDTEGPAAHVHEGLRLADGSGWVAVGGSLPAENQNTLNFKVMLLQRLLSGYTGKERKSSGCHKICGQ